MREGTLIMHSFFFFAFLTVSRFKYLSGSEIFVRENVQALTRDVFVKSGC